MSTYRFTLEPYSGKNSRFTCPSCKRNYQFTRYIDTVKKTYVSVEVGICNRVVKCGYHYSPKQYFNNQVSTQPVTAYLPSKILVKPVNQKVDYISPVTLKKSMNSAFRNNFVTYLNSIIDSKKVKQLIKAYNIGTYNNSGNGSTIFWQVDTQSKIRTGKIITYSMTTGKRSKKLYPQTNWVHSIMNFNSFNLKQCLFGEHLLKHYPNKPVAIVESEKTAIIATAKLPDFIWMATGSINEFKSSKLNVLKGCRIVAFPDLGAYDYWLKKASGLDFQIEVSDYLEKCSTTDQKKQGLDIADFL